MLVQCSRELGSVHRTDAPGAIDVSRQARGEQRRCGDVICRRLQLELAGQRELLGRLGRPVAIIVTHRCLDYLRMFSDATAFPYSPFGPSLCRQWKGEVALLMKTPQRSGPRKKTTDSAVTLGGANARASMRCYVGRYEY